MPTDEIQFNGKEITVAGQTWTVAYPVADAKIVDGRVVLIYGRSSGPSWRQFQNLHACDLDGNALWTAEHPTNTTADFYVQFIEGDQLSVLNFASYVCQIEPETGKLKQAIFTK